MAGSVHAAPPVTVARCDRVPTSPDAIIQACTAALQDSALQPPARAHLLVIRAQAEDMSGKNAEALADFGQVIELDSKQVQALNDAAKRKGPGAFQATSIADTYVGVLNGDLATAYADRGVAALRQGQLDAGIADLSNAIQVVPDYPPVLVLRGRAWRLKGRLDLALTDLNAALRGDPTNLAALLCRAHVYADQSDTVRAIADLDEAVRVAPKSFDAYVGRSSLRADRRDYAGARTDIDAAIALQPDDPAGPFNRATIWLREGQPEKAVTDFSTAIDLYSTGHRSSEEPPGAAHGYAAALIARAGAYELLGKSADAEADAERAVQLDPTPASWNNRCWMRAVANDALAGALADCDRALELGPSPDIRAAILDSRALVRYRQRQFDLAVADEDAAIAASSAAPSFRFLKGLAEQRLGKAEEGRADVAAALAADPKLAEQYARWGLKPD